jgi:hypothetical protein
LQQQTSTVDDAKAALAGFRPATFEVAPMRDAFALISEAVVWAKQLKLTGSTDSSGRPVLDDMEGGGFSGGPQGVLTPQQRLVNELDSRLDVLIQLYLGAIGQQELSLRRELASQ